MTRAFLLLGDTISFALSFALAYFLRYDLLANFFKAGPIPWSQYLNILPFIALVWIFTMALEGLYGEPFLDPLDELFYIGRATLITALLFLSFSFLYRLLSYSRAVMMLSFIVSLPILFPSSREF